MAWAQGSSEYRRWQREHPNFMTPYVRSVFRSKGNKLIELSEGTGLEHEPIYGVTVIEHTDGGFKTRWDLEQNRMFRDYSEARAHALKLKKVL